ncbi:MAG: class I SAM-dependent methyltransferase [Bacteroidota bacterium]
MKDFTYKEQDDEGLATLETISKADKFNQWMFETILAEVEGSTILEIGSGIGNISQQFLDKGYTLTLSDIRAQYCQELASTFSSYDNLGGVVLLDLVHPQFEEEYADHLLRYDSIFALNVVEHIEDDGLALRNACKLLKPKGRLVILVPAYQTLYNNFDVALYHYRRYTRSTLKKLFLDNGLKVDKDFHFNFMGIFGWWLFGSVFKRKLIPENPMGWFNTLVPIFKLLDRMVLRKIGLSVIVSGNKQP